MFEPTVKGPVARFKDALTEARRQRDVLLGAIDDHEAVMLKDQSFGYGQPGICDEQLYIIRDEIRSETKGERLDGYR